DFGSRRLLNLGHTFGHAVEACSGYTVSHGNSVAIGMSMIARAALHREICKADTLDRLLSILQRYQLPTETAYSAQELYRAALNDKKLSGGTLELVVPEEIGRCRLEMIAADEIPSWLRDGGAR
ncbi:MAG: 3-dehydroquinate synthase, partial [Oscillospiraceae bacterium]|nr:3-dehydroquinate synthase [Oscillospiraceae bacterium]